MQQGMQAQRLDQRRKTGRNAEQEGGEHTGTAADQKDATSGTAFGTRCMQRLESTAGSRAMPGQPKAKHSSTNCATSARTCPSAAQSLCGTLALCRP